MTRHTRPGGEKCSAAIRLKTGVRAGDGKKNTDDKIASVTVEMYCENITAKFA